METLGVKNQKDNFEYGEPQAIEEAEKNEEVVEGPKLMRAIMIEALGQPLIVKQVPIPKLSSGQLLVKIEAVPINPSDLGFLNAFATFGEDTPQRQIGFEGAGIVISSGGGLIARALVGKRVAFAAATHPGTWAEYAVCDTSSCFPLDKRISSDVGACAIVNPFTALALVNVIKKEKHQAVVHTTGGSSLGRMIVKLLKKEGIKTINIIKQENHRGALDEIGADVVLNSEHINFDEDLKAQISTLNATCCLECVCGETTHKILKSLPPKSNCYVYGLLAEDKLSANDFSDFLLHSKTIKAFNTFDWLHEQGFFKKLGLIRKVESMIKQEKRNDILRSFRFEEVNEAIKFYQENITLGKVLLKPDIFDDDNDEGIEGEGELKSHLHEMSQDPAFV